VKKKTALLAIEERSSQLEKQLSAICQQANGFRSENQLNMQAAIKANSSGGKLAR
jgi:hypothetical protein